MRRLSHRARDTLRQVNDQPRPFVPTLSVERAVLFVDDKQAKTYKKAMNAELGKNLGQRRRRHYRVLPPEDLSLTLVEPRPLINEFRRAHTRPKAEDIQRLAQLLRDRLYELIKDTPPELSLTLGKLACFDVNDVKRPPYKRQVVGVEPCGWDGPKAHYAHDTSLGLLSQESRLCAETITEAYRDLGHADVVQQPYIPLLGSNRIPAGDFRDIRFGLEAALPGEFVLGDPTIMVRTGTGSADVAEINIRPHDTVGQFTSAM